MEMKKVYKKRTFFLINCVRRPGYPHAGDKNYTHLIPHTTIKSEYRQDFHIRPHRYRHKWQNFSSVDLEMILNI